MNTHLRLATKPKGWLQAELKRRIEANRPRTVEPTREPLPDCTIYDEQPVKLFGLTLWWRRVARPSLNTQMRRAIK